MGTTAVGNRVADKVAIVTGAADRCALAWRDRDPHDDRSLSSPESTKAIVGTTILERPDQPEEVSNVVLFLASDEASFVTGAECLVGGGYATQ